MTLVLLRPFDKFAPSQNPYWFARGTLDGERIDAVWAGRKDGRTTLTLGTYHLWPARANWRDGFDRLDVLDRIALTDTRYGGNWNYRFDGVRHLTEPMAAGTDRDHEQQVRDWLERMLAGLPDSLAADGWVGPFYRTEVEMDR